MARPDTHPAVSGDDGADNRSDEAPAGSNPAGSAPAPVDASDYVVRPGTGVVRPGTGVVRPGSGTGASAAAAEGASAVQARAVVPDAPQTPLEPIHVVLPVIPVMPAKQGFLDRLVAPKPPKPTKAEKAEQKKRDKQAKEDDESYDDDYDEDEYDEPEIVAEVVTPTPAPAPAPHPVRPPPPPSASARVEAPPAPPPVVAPPPAPAPVAPAPAPQPVAPQPVAPPPPPPPPVSRPQPAPAPAPPMRPAPPPPAPPRRPPGPPPGPMPGARPGGPPRPGFAPRPLRRLPGRRPPQADYDYDERWSEREYVKPIRKGRWLVAAVVLAVLAAGTGAVVGLRGPATRPSWVAAPPAAVVAPVLAGLAADAPRPSPGGLAAALQPMLADSRLGPQVRMSVIDVKTGEHLFDYGGTIGATPASTAKLLTAAAVLHTRGPAYQIPTRAYLGSTPGEVVLVGGGDPTLAAGPNGAYPGAGRLDLLAAQVIKALGGQAPTKVTVDSSLFTGPAYSPNWDPSDRNEFITNITSLMIDGGLKDPKRPQGKTVFAPEPDLAAGQAFATALGLPKSAVVTRGAAPAGADELGQVFSLPVSRMVEIMLTKSDNIVAEAMARQVALASNAPASFAGGAQSTLAVLNQLKLPMDGIVLVDGSGLSYTDKVTAGLLTGLLAGAASADHPDLRPIISGLPVAAYSGTLNDRYLAAGANTAAGVVRAKTGTLKDVDSLAGLAVDADGRLLAFSVLADLTPSNGPAEQAMDRIAAVLAGCGCG